MRIICDELFRKSLLVHDRSRCFARFWLDALCSRRFGRRYDWEGLRDARAERRRLGRVFSAGPEPEGKGEIYAARGRAMADRDIPPVRLDADDEGRYHRELFADRRYRAMPSSIFVSGL